MSTVGLHPPFGGGPPFQTTQGQISCITREINPHGVPLITMEPLDLSLSTQFEVAKYTRIIEATTNVAALQKVALELLQAWAVQKATTAWVIRGALGKPPSVTPESLNREV